MSALFRRSDRGWTLAQYGPLMTDRIAGLLFYEWYMQYEDLLVPLLDFRSAFEEWQNDARGRTNDALFTGDISQFHRLKQISDSLGPDTLELKLVVDSIESLKSKDIVWGYARATKLLSQI